MTTSAGKAQRVNKSLQYSVLDGSAFSAMAGLTGNYITPFALALKATTAQIGLLTSVPSLLMSLAQLSAPRLSEKAGSRKGLVLPTVFLHALMWLPVFLVPYLVPNGKVWWLIAFVSVSTVLGAMANPAWGSMMADLVPQRIRGRYFAARGRIASLVALVFMFLAGGILQLAGPNVFLGFAILFGGAVVFRLLSFYFLTRMWEPPAVRTDGSSGRLGELVKGLGSSNLGRFTIIMALMSFSTNLAAPFFSVYMLRDLHFSYLSYVIVTGAGSLSYVLFLTYWGRRADRAGNIRVIRISWLLVPLVPVVWLASHEVWYLVIVQTFASFAWAASDLATGNFVLEAAPAEVRTGWIALYAAMNGTAVCVGSLAGGLLASYLPPILGYPLLTLFALSGVLRAIVAVLLRRSVREVRKVPSVGLLQLLFTRHRANHVAAPEGE